MQREPVPYNVLPKRVGVLGVDDLAIREVHGEGTGGGRTGLCENGGARARFSPVRAATERSAGTHRRCRVRRRPWRPWSASARSRRLEISRCENDARSERRDVRAGRRPRAGASCQWSSSRARRGRPCLGSGPCRRAYRARARRRRPSARGRRSSRARSSAARPRSSQAAGAGGGRACLRAGLDGREVDEEAG
jgi:hypothetical protein